MPNLIDCGGRRSVNALAILGVQVANRSIDLGGHFDQGIGKAFRIGRIAAAVDFPDLWPSGRHDGASAAEDG